MHAVCNSNSEILSVVCVEEVLERLAFFILWGFFAVLMANPFVFMESKSAPCTSLSSEQAHMRDEPGISFSREADSPEDDM